ncbi:hypothetical protein SLA2020_414790 [Shorea laevis]
MGSFLSAQTKPANLKPAAPFSVFSLFLSIPSLNRMHPHFPTISLSSLSLSVVASVSAKAQEGYLSFWAAAGPGDVTIGFHSFGF